MLKLPKDLVPGPDHDAIQAILAADPKPLWESGANPVPTLSLSLALAGELKHALAAGLATQGLEQIAKELANEQKGLDALVAKNPSAAQTPRISRLLFVAGDGSERFYRECDSLLTRYSQRLLAVKLDITGEAFGQAISHVPKLMKAVLVSDKRAAARVLASLVKPGPAQR